MNYTLHQLRVFLKVTETKSITKAADMLSLTQPAVSIQLKKFQEEFDIPLTEVIGRQLYITEFGKEVAESCRNILNEASKLRHKTMTHKGFITGRLKIVVSSSGKYVAPYLLSRFLRLNPGIELSLDVANKQHAIRKFEENKVDFAMVSLVPKDLKYEGIHIMQNPLYCIAAPDLAAKKIGPKSTFVIREGGSATRTKMEEYLQLNDLKSSKYIELTSNEAIKQSVLAGIGYSFTPLVSIKNELEKGLLKIVPLKGLPIETNWQIIYQPDKKFSPAAAAYLEFIKEEKVSLVGEHFSWMEAY
jgi:DNA-binding transcriptional LysR family regulator